MRSQLQDNNRPMFRPGSKPVTRGQSPKGNGVVGRVSSELVNLPTEGPSERKPDADNLSDQSAALTQTSILRHVHECKLDNKLRLKQVRNLEELIKFRIKTVSENLVEDGTLVNPVSTQNGLYELRKVMDPLLTSTAMPAVTSQKHKYRDIKAKTHKMYPDSLIVQNESPDRLSMQINEIEQGDSIMQEVAEEVEEPTKTDKRRSYLIPTTVTTSKTNSATKRVNQNNPKTMNQQIDEILKLDEHDPIRKLQQYFKDSHYDHDHDEEGMRIPRRYRAPKHKNQIMQRYENKRLRAQVRNQATIGRAASQPHQGGDRGVPASQMSDELSMNRSIDNDDHDYVVDGSRAQFQLKSRQQNNPNVRAQSEQRLKQTNFLGQLKQLQELLKESMLDALNNDDDMEKLNKNEVATPTTLVDNKPTKLSLPKLVKGGQLSQDSRQSSFNKSLRRGSTRKNLDMLDQISSYKHDAKDLVHKYFPTNGEIQEGNQDTRSEATSFESQKSGTLVQPIGEVSSETSQSDRIQKKNKHRSIRQVGKTIDKNQRQESLNQTLLKGVDSDEDVLEELMKNAKELKKLQLDSQNKRNSNEEVEQLMQVQKLRQEMANGLRLLVDPSQLTHEQRELIYKVTGKPVSTISQISAVREKDYVKYNEEQLRIFRILNSQNESQKRMARVNEKRTNYQGSQERAILGQKAHQMRMFAYNSETRRSYCSMQAARVLQPFTKKKFVEDILKPAFDFNVDKAADKLPKIMYGSQRFKQQSQLPSGAYQSQKQVRTLELQVATQGMHNKVDSQFQTILLQENTQPTSQRTTMNRQQRKNRERLHNAAAIGNQGRAIPTLATQLQANFMVTNQQQQRSIPVMMRDRKMQASSGFNDDLDNHSQAESDLMRISGVSPFKQTMKDSSHMSGMGKLISQHGRSKSMGLHSGEEIDAEKQEDELNQDLNGKQSIAVGNSDGDIGMESSISPLAEVNSEKIPMSGITSQQHLKIDDQEVDDQKDIADPVSATSRQKIPLIHVSSAVDELDNKAAGTLEPSDDQFREDIVGVHGHMQRNQSSFNQDTEKHLSNKDKLVIQNSTSDLHDEISRRQSFIYHDSIATATVAGGENTELSPTQSKGHPQQESAIDSIEGTPQNTLLVSTALLPQNDKLAATSQEFKVTQSSNFSKMNESTESLKLILKKAQQDIEKTLEKVEESDRYQVKQQSPALLEAGAPRKVQIRHGNIATGGDSNSDEMPDNDTTRQPMQMSAMKNTQAFKMPKRETGIQTHTNIVDYPIRNAQGIANIGLHVGASRKVSRMTTIGYESESPMMDPNSMRFKRDVAESLMHSKQQMRAKGWQSKRFKKFPRFSIYLQKDKTNSHLERNYISLNNRMMAYLAEEEPEEAPQAPIQQQYRIDELQDDSIESANAILLIQDVKQMNNQGLDQLLPQLSTKQMMTSSMGSAEGHEIVTAIVEPVMIIRNQHEQHITIEAQSPADDTVMIAESPINTNSKASIVVTANHPSQDQLQSHLIENSIASMMEPSDIRLEAVNKPANPKQQKQIGKMKNVEQLPYMQNEQQPSPIKGIIAIATTADHSEQSRKNEMFIPTTTVIDPFDRVLLLKNIDNAILTSFRTLNKQNNVISSTLKVIHNKFTPNMLSRHVKNTFKKATMALYSVSENESSDDADDDITNQDYVVPSRQQKRKSQQKNRDLPTQSSKMRSLLNKKHIELADLTNHEESLLSSVEDTPGLKLDDFTAVQPYEYLASQDRDNMLKSSTATVEHDNEYSASMAMMKEQNYSIEDTGYRVQKSKVIDKSMSRDYMRKLSPVTDGTLPNDTGQEATRANNGNVEFQNYHDEQQVIHSANRFIAGEQTFTEKSRLTAAFGNSVLKKKGNDDFAEVRSSGTTPTGKSSYNAPAPDKVAHDILMNGKQVQRDDTVTTRRESNKNVNSSMPSARQSLDQQKHQETLENTNDDTTNVLLQVVNQPVPNHYLKNAKIDSRDMQPTVSGHMIPIILPINAKRKLPNLGQKREQRDRIPIAQQMGKRVKVQEANVDDYLGELRKRSPQPYAAGNFKTSKIILQVKQRVQEPLLQQQMRSKTQMETSEDQQVQQDKLPQQNQNRYLMTQMSNNTNSTFVFNDSLFPKFGGDRNAGMTQDRSHSSQAARKIRTIQNSKRESFDLGRKQLEYSQHLNQVIDHQQHIHGGKTVGRGPTDYSNMKKHSNASMPKVSGKDYDHVSIHMDNLHRSNDQNFNASLGLDSQMEHSLTNKLNELVKEPPLDGKKLPANASFSGQTNPFSMPGKQDMMDMTKKSFDHSKPTQILPSTANQNTQRITNNGVSTNRVVTANNGSIKTELDIGIYQSQDQVAGARMKQLAPGPETNRTPKLLQPCLSNLDQMLVRNSPSHNSHIESNSVLAGKMQHSVTGATKLNTISDDMPTINRERNQKGISNTVDGGPSVKQSPQKRSDHRKSSVDVQQGTKNLEIKENKSHLHFRQTALMKQGSKKSSGPFVKVPQPNDLAPQEQDKGTGVIKESSYFTLKQPVSSTVSLKNDLSLATKAEVIEPQPPSSSQLVIETHRRVTEQSQDEQSVEKYKAEHNEQHEIAQRIVMPKSVHRVRQMIDSLCQKEKSVVYQNPNIRDDCIGTQNSIFDLSASHMIDRPGILNGQAKRAEKNLKNLSSEASFAGNSFLAGQKATLSSKPAAKMTDKRIIAETKRNRSNHDLTSASKM